MNTHVLKWIAVVSMVVDHFAAIFLARTSVLWLVMRCIGRFAFPIYVFLLVEGFNHTRSVRKYLFRMGLFAIISEIPFDLAFQGKLLEFQDQNVFFTLFLGLLCIYILREIELRFSMEIPAMLLWEAAIIAVFCIIAYFLKADYGYAGILLIAAFYLFRNNKVLCTASLLSISGFLLGYINVLATFAMLPIAFYNGQKGKSKKYFFYVFYPAHLLLFGLIKLLI